MKKTLLFVYNAQSGGLAKYLDTAHKIISPSTYSCDLCSLTHGNFSEKNVWKDFREKTNHELIFLYKNEFLNTYNTKKHKIHQFPIVLEEKEDNYEVLIDTKEFKYIDSVEHLIKILQTKLQ